MAHIKMLINSATQHLRNTINGQQEIFSTRDHKYAYSQPKIHKDTAKH